MPSAASAPVLKKLVEERFSLLANELQQLFNTHVATSFAPQLNGEVQSAVLDAMAENRQSARCELADELNQAVRRLRQAANFAEISSVLADASASFCGSAAVFRISQNLATVERVRGLEGEDLSDRLRNLQFPVSQAAAFAGAVESGDPLAALSTDGEVSPAVREIFGHGREDRVSLFPLVVAQNTIGLLYAWGAVQMAPLELLTQMAAAVLEARMRVEHGPSPEPLQADLVAIEPAKPAPGKSALPEQPVLTPQDQQLHLRAQRFARVRVAQMRLYRPDAVQSGRSEGDLYTALHEDIDSGREVFQHMFLSASPTMVDYFHSELVRTLANDDARLLGEKYPGPLL